MNPITDMLFTIIWLGLLVWAIRTMARGVTSQYVDPGESEFSIKTRTVTKPQHPEMAEVKQGDELLVVKFGGKEKKDPLLQSLENRITELEDTSEDEEDDDGDVIVRR